MTVAAEAKEYGVFGVPPSKLVDDAMPGARQFSPLIPRSAALEDVVPGSLAGMIMSAAPGTLERRHDMALMLRALTPGGPFAVLAPKDMGGARLRAELAGLGCTVEESAKRHHRICSGARPGALEGIEAAIRDGAPRRLDGLGLWSQPGIFSWNRIDPGTSLLIEALPDLSGRGADLGCGIGMLAHRVLASAKVLRLSLVDIDRRAIEAAGHNVDDARADVVWADARGDLPFADLDFVVTNPPFHAAGAEDKGLGIAFIERAACLLRTGGHLWLVANRHLPYERLLKAHFRRATLVREAQGFKVIAALK